MTSFPTTEQRALIEAALVDPSIVTVFEEIARTWSIEVRDEKVKAYCHKQMEGEYETERDPDDPARLIRRGSVTKLCLTRTVGARHYLLITPPTHSIKEHGRGRLGKWKLPGGRCHPVDERPNWNELGQAPAWDQDHLASLKSIVGDWNSVFSTSTWITSDGEHIKRRHERPDWLATDQAVKHVLTGLREANEELNFDVGLDLHIEQGGTKKWLICETGSTPDEAKFRLTEHKPEVVLTVRHVEVHENRSPEPEGDEKYPGIRRESTLMYLHATCLSDSETLPLDAPMISEATAVSPSELWKGITDPQSAGNPNPDRPFAWLPLTPSVIEVLSEGPFLELPSALLHEHVEFSTYARTAVPTHHAHSFVEVFLNPEDKHAPLRQFKHTWNEKQHSDMNALSALEIDVDEFPLSEDLVAEITQSRFLLKHKKGGKDRKTGLAKNRLPLHARSETLKLQRTIREAFRRGELVHGFAYRQPKRTKPHMMLAAYGALQKLSLRRAKKPVPKESDEEVGALHIAGRIVSLLEKEIDGANPFTDYLERSPRSLIETIMNEMDQSEGNRFQNILENASGRFSWNNLMRRVHHSYDTMQMHRCPRCNVEKDEACLLEHRQPIQTSAPSDARNNTHTRTGKIIPRLQWTAKEPLHAAAGHLLFRSIVTKACGESAPPFSTAGIFASDVEENFQHLNTEPLNPTWPRQAKAAYPQDPFCCSERYQDYGLVSKLGSTLLAHTRPLDTTVEASKKAKTTTGASQFFGTKDPSVFVQNLMADVVRRDLTWLQAHQAERLELIRGDKANLADRLLWEFITHDDDVRTVEIDENRPAKIPLLGFSQEGVVAGPRFNDDRAANLGGRPNWRTVKAGGEWTWDWTPQVLQGILPIVSPDCTLAHLIDVICMNGIGAAIAIDEWDLRDDGLANRPTPAMDKAWYIDSGLFKDETTACRTMPSFLSALHANDNLAVKAHNVKHTRRLYGVVLLEDVMAFLQVSSR